MRCSFATLALALGAAAVVKAQAPATTVDTAVQSAQSSVNGTFNSATTARIISTDTASTARTSSASNTASATFSVPFFNVSSVPASAASETRTASSNFTLPTPTATASFPPNFVMQNSNPFVYSEVDTANLPMLKYNLLNETVLQRQIICDQQTKFCTTAGCAEEGAKIKENVCNVDTMAVMCRCDKGASNLNQWKWPVQFQDCLRRGTTCSNSCALPGGTTAERNDCKSACQRSFADTCGFPNQYSANYAVSKPNGKPSLTMMQGGNAAGAMSIRAASGVVFSVAIVASVVLFA